MLPCAVCVVCGHTHAGRRALPEQERLTMSPGRRGSRWLGTELPCKPLNLINCFKSIATCLPAVCGLSQWLMPAVAVPLNP